MGGRPSIADGSACVRRQGIGARECGMAELDPTILSFYRDRYDEGQRLVQSRHGRLEFQRTQQLLRRQLPAPPATVLDVGGGTGVHARWLAEDGYDVHLIDPVAHHIAQASTYGGFTYAIGDARRLEVADHCFDVTLLLGPLYHLTDAGDRAQALAEAVRVTRAGGYVAVAAISRYAALLELAGFGELDEAAASVSARLMQTGINEDDPNGFTTAYFHRADDLAEEMTVAGLTHVRVLGVEGPSVPALDNASPESAANVFASAVRCAELVETDSALVSASPHFLGLGRVNLN